VNEKAVVDAIHTVIDGVRDTLVSGFYHQGTQRQIEHIFRSNLTPPGGGISISIHCTRAREWSMAMSNATQGKNVGHYEIELHVVDLAFPQPDDPAQTPYETMHQDFRKLCGRLVLLIRETTTWWPNSTASPKFELLKSNSNDRVVNVDNRAAWYDDGAGAYPVLFSVISFTLVEECVDTGSLYD